MSTKKEKQKRVDKLKEQIQKIWDEPVDDNYELIAVTPDGGGVRDMTGVVAISKDMDLLVDYCKKTYSYTPILSDRKAESDKSIWGTWYRLSVTDIIIVN